MLGKKYENDYENYETYELRCYVGQMLLESTPVKVFVLL